MRMTRIDLENREKQILSPLAAKSAESRGRQVEEEPCATRTDFQRDRDRIIHSKAFRRLMHKTQVFLAPEGDHFRTRLTHTIEVSQIARTIARALNLNEDLTEAIALGHDLRHTPFGHNGEDVLNQIHPGGFEHNVQSLRVVDYLESNGTRRGMNLTQEVRDGIVNHTGKDIPFTLEGQIVKISDRIAYINHDIDDALRSGVISYSDIPVECINVLGRDHRNRINTLVNDMIENSIDKDHISLSKKCSHYMNLLRSFMFEHVYQNPVAKSEEVKAINMIKNLYEYYVEHIEALPKEYLQMMEIKAIKKEQIICDYIAGMTDNYAVMKFQEAFEPLGWKR